MFGATSSGVGPTSIAFVSQASLIHTHTHTHTQGAGAAGAGVGVEGVNVQNVKGLGLQKHLEAVKNNRTIGKKDMKLNDALPKIKVDPETYVVTADGVVLTCEPLEKLPLTQRYFLF
jgi:urease alpha subunit